MNATSALGWALLNFLWQGMLLVLLARLVLSLLPRRHAPARYAVAVGALVLMPVTVVLSIARGIEQPWPIAAAALEAGQAAQHEETTVASSARSAAALSAPDSPTASLEGTPGEPAPSGVASVPLAGTTAWRQRVNGLLPWIVGAWALGVVALALRHLASYSAVRRFVRAHGEPVPESVLAMLARLSARLGVKRAVRVCSSSVTHVPAVAGWLEPVVLLPAAALAGLSRAQLEAVLAHELAHVKRHDYLVNLVQTLIETLLFYHPAVWWLGARIREEREHCCDDLAVAACGSAPLYAEALLSMEELRGAPELALALTRGSLLTRVERLLAPRARTELFPRWIAGLSAVAVVLFACATTELVQPAQGQQRDQREQREKQRRDKEQQRDRGQQGENGHQREAVRREQVPTGAGDVHVHPDHSRALLERSEWALRLAAEHGYDEFWIGHSIASMPAFEKGILMGRFDHVGGLVIGNEDGDGGITLMGGFLSIGDPGSLQLPGVALAPLVQADPADLGVLYLWSVRSGRAVIRRVHVATAGLAVDFEGLPLLWLGHADDRDSVQDVLAVMKRAATEDIRKNLVGVVGAHGSSAVVVPELVRFLSSKDDEEFRSEAAEWLSYHPDMDALRALDRAARGDRSERVRREAAEAVSEMKFAPAFDVLVALAHELADSEARREAVEGLGQRSEPAAVPALLEIASTDRDEDVQREAVESLGDLPDGAGLNALATVARTHRSQDARREAVETFGECAPPGEALTFLLERSREDPKSDVRREAVETLGELQDPRVADVLVDLVHRSDDPEVQREAVETLGELPDHAGMNALAAILGSHASEDVRREAAETYGECAPPGQALGLLQDVAERDPSADVRREAVETLGELDDERVVGVLADIAERSEDPDVQREAVETLGETVAGPAVLPLLERIARRHPSTDIQREAVETLGELDDEDGQVRDLLTALATDHRTDLVRAEAVETLADVLAAPEAKKLFERLLRTERSPLVRDELKDALEELSEDDE